MLWADEDTAYIVLFFLNIVSNSLASFNHWAGTALISLKVYNKPLCINSALPSFTAVALHPFENYCSISHLWLQDFLFAWVKWNELLTFSNVGDRSSSGGPNTQTDTFLGNCQGCKFITWHLVIAHICPVSVNQMNLSRDELIHTQSWWKHSLHTSLWQQTPFTQWARAWDDEVKFEDHFSL